MPALSKATIVSQVFEALVNIDDFPLSLEELNAFLPQSSFKMNSVSQKKTSSDRKTSVYNCYLNDNKDTSIEERRENWKTISSNKESEEYLKYQLMADDINASKNLPSKEDIKTKKSDKAKADKAALQKQIEELKKQVQNQAKSESLPEAQPQPQVQPEPEPEPEPLEDLHKTLTQFNETKIPQYNIPEWNIGDKLIYTTTGEIVEIINIHRDDIEPYYTIRMNDGREKQTISTKLEINDVEPKISIL